MKNKKKIDSMSLTNFLTPKSFHFSDPIVQKNCGVANWVF